MSDLAKRLLACPRFRWMPGMRANDQRIVACDPNSSDVCIADEGCTEEGHTARWVEPQRLRPDLSDPATLGCLLALVREAHKQPNAYARLRRNPRSFEGLYWEVLANAEEWRESALGHGSTEAAALVAALEAAL